MEHVCLVDGRVIKSMTWLSRHLRKNGYSIMEYAKKYFTFNEIPQSCGFCYRDAIPSKIEFDDDKKICSLEYKKGYLCDTMPCKQKISMDILGHEYTAKTYEKIGSKAVYAARKNKQTIEVARAKKYNIAPSARFPCTLEKFIEKYGAEDGSKRYKERGRKIGFTNTLKYYEDKYGENADEKYSEFLNKIKLSLAGYVSRHGEEQGKLLYEKRCNQIAYTNTLDFYTEKFGQVEGERRWFSYKNKLGDRRYNKQSTASKKINRLLDSLGIQYESEKFIQCNKKGYHVDYYLPEYNTVIEFYGDYWHCNPKKYQEDFYNKTIKIHAVDIWKRDSKRLEVIKDSMIGVSIMIVWESTKLDTELFENYLNTIKNKNTTIYL